MSLESLLSRQSADLVARPAARDDIAIWKFTTGSTGRPKACVHTSRSPIVNFEGYAQGVLGLRSEDIVLPVPKLFFGYARDLVALFPFGVGGTGVIFAERTTPELIFELIARHRPTILVNVPTMMQAMLDHPSAARQDLSCLRLCTSAGEALPEPLHRRWNQTFGIEVLDGIGSSEAYHIYISNRPGRVRPGSIGEVVPGYAAEVVDEQGNPVPDGQIGRLWVRGESAARMYWQDHEASARTFAPDLVMSEDLVERDADGYFQYRGRADDLLKVGGIWVAPAEIERCLATHPQVVECAVVAAQQDGLTRGCAWVVLTSGAAATPETLQAFVRERLSPHKVPGEVRVVTETAEDRLGQDRSARAARAHPGGRHRRKAGVTRFRASAGFTEQWKHFDFAVTDGVATITLTRPEQLGALTFDVYADLRDLLAELPHRGDARVLVITGTGRGFCSGGDVVEIIGALQSMQPGDLLEFTRMTGSVVKGLRELPLPVIAAVNGVAAGAGAVIALASDLRLLARSARFAFLFTKVGLSGADMGSAYLLPRVIGFGRATELLLLGDTVDAERALEIGLATAVVDDQALPEAALAMARLLAGGPALAYSTTKLLLTRELDIGLGGSLELDAMTQALLMGSHDHGEYHRAWTERRAPIWEGR